MIQARFAFFLLMLSLVSGCNVIARPLQIEPARKATPISPRFSQSYYYFDRDQNLYFVMRASSSDPATGKPVEQIATIRVFWQPKGGVTTLDPTALNATFRYIIMTPDAVGMYEGAGFVRLSSKEGASRFQARIMDGDMRLSQASNSFVDTLGRAHVRGTFSAVYDDAKAVDMLRDTEQQFFARSLKSKVPETSPATTTTPTTSP
jgi:hypothetical protein